MKAEIIERDRFKCTICNKYLTTCTDAKRIAKLGENLFHIDHIIPVSQGGRATMENLRLTCPTCNLERKRYFTIAEILEMSANDDTLPQVAASCRELPPESNPIQSESNPNPNPNPNVCTERYDDRSMQEPIIVIELPLNDKTMYAVTVEDVKKYKELYQAVDVEQELRKMLGWLDANPSKRKTSRGIKRFITNWLSKEQDKGGTRNRAPTYRSDRDNRGNFSTSFDDYEYDDGALTRVTMPRIEGSP
jgi:hypothetical protein